ncbi:hypothetical protein D3C75_744540 [compost metagenome]
MVAFIVSMSENVTHFPRGSQFLSGVVPFPGAHLRQKLGVSQHLFVLLPHCNFPGNRQHLLHFTLRITHNLEGAFDPQIIPVFMPDSAGKHIAV